MRFRLLETFTSLNIASPPAQFEDPLSTDINLSSNNTASNTNKMSSSNNLYTEGLTALAGDSDTKHLIAAIALHAAAPDELTQQAQRLCCVNAALRDDLRKSRDELRTSKQKQAVMEDALGEMRAELSPTRDVLTRVWDFAQSRGLQVPEELKREYESLVVGDPFDIKPAYSSNAGVKKTVKQVAQSGTGGQRKLKGLRYGSDASESGHGPRGRVQGG